MDYDPSKPLPLQELRAFERCFDVESECMATDRYFDRETARHRSEAVHVVVHHSKTEKFDAFIPYLAINYFDRYITRHSLPTLGNHGRCSVKLLAICCLTLAWKMRSKSFSIEKFLEKIQDNEIDGLKLLKVELIILNALNWRMRAVTAICFVGYFYNVIQSDRRFKRRTLNEIIVQAQGDIIFTQFKPSVIAASALLAATENQDHDSYIKYRDKISNDVHINEEDLERCVGLMISMCERKRIVSGEPPSQPAPNEASTSTQLRCGEGKAPMGEKQEVPESEEGAQMNFKLKWITEEIIELEPVEPRVDASSPESEQDANKKCCSGLCTLL